MNLGTDNLGLSSSGLIDPSNSAETMRRNPIQARLYNDLAKWWPLVSPPEDYADEAEILRATFREKLGSGDHSLLDLGVGGGSHLSHLTTDFRATGIDLSTEMLALSRRLNPSVQHQVGDMRSIRLHKEFDAVLIHDAISYLLSEEDLRATLATARAHLRPGGVLVMCPDWFQETFPDEFVDHEKHTAGDTSVTYIEYIHDPDPTDTTVEIVMFILIKEMGRLRIERDYHTLGLFPKTTWLELTTEAGFSFETRPFVKAVFGVELELLVAVLPN
jgi:SAM-dependent methyltransferase